MNKSPEEGDRRLRVSIHKKIRVVDPHLRAFFATKSCNELTMCIRALQLRPPAHRRVLFAVDTEALARLLRLFLAGPRRDCDGSAAVCVWRGSCT